MNESMEWKSSQIIALVIQMEVAHFCASLLWKKFYLSEKELPSMQIYEELHPEAIISNQMCRTELGWSDR